MEVHGQSGNAEDRHKPSKQIRFKTLVLRSDLCDFTTAYIVVKVTVTVTYPNNDVYDKKLAFKNNARGFFAFQKLIIHSLTMQKI